MDPVLLSADAVARMARALRRVEGPAESEFDAEPVESNDPGFFLGSVNVQFVKVTSATQTDGRYPAVLKKYDQTASPGSRWADGDVCWLESPNGETLATNRTYLARMQGYDESHFIFIPAREATSGIGRTTTTISALSGAVWGSGTVEDYKLNADGTLTDLGTTRTVYSLFGASLPKDIWVKWDADEASGLASITAVQTDCVAVRDDCSATVSFRNLPARSLDPCSQCDSDSGGGPCIPACDGVCFQTAFPGVSLGALGTALGCSTTPLTGTVQMIFVPGTCVWTGYDVSGGFNCELDFNLSLEGNLAILEIGKTAGNTVLAFYTADITSWNCISTLTMTRTTGSADALGMYTSWPASISLDPCAPGGGGSAVWLDHFTAANGTLLTAHMPNTSPCILLPCYTATDGSFEIQSNTLVPKTYSSLRVTINFSPLQTVCTGSVIFTVNNANGGSIAFGMAADGFGPVATLLRNTGSTYDFWLGSDPPVSVTITNGTPYTLTVQYTGTNVIATVNGVTISKAYTSTGGTIWELVCGSAAADVTSYTFDDLEVTSP